MTVESFWLDYLNKMGAPDTPIYEVFYFCSTEELANKLLQLVLDDKKRATSSLYDLYKDESEMPKVGCVSIVTDFDGNPRCVIKTTAVTILPFNKITFDICKREGEDECLEQWQKGHRHFFGEECKEQGKVFDENMLVLFEDFEVVYSK